MRDGFKKQLTIKLVYQELRFWPASALQCYIWSESDLRLTQSINGCCSLQNGSLDIRPALSLASYVTNATGAVRDHGAIVRCWPIRSHDAGPLANHRAEKYKHDLGKVQLSGSEFPSLNYVLVLRLSPQHSHSNCRCSKLRDTLTSNRNSLIGC